IDVLFETAAEAYPRRLLGLILTGANEDGAKGLAAVQAAGGMTVVQEPEGAHSTAMLLAALGHADQVLTLQQIAELLASLGARR
ncbi:MAG: chemotaxis protein CheB, partial [Steroidobacteraceae bacterium]